MKRKKCLFLCLLILILGCQSKSNHKKEVDQTYVIMDYFQDMSFDTTAMIEGVSNYVAYPLLNIAGKTFPEIVDKYGSPENSNVFDLDIGEGYEKGTLRDVLSFILQKFPSPIKIYDFQWKPYKNKELILSVYFIEENDSLKVIYGEQTVSWILQLE